MAEGLDQDTLVARENVWMGGSQDAVYVDHLNPGINDWALMKTLSMDAGMLAFEGDTLAVYSQSEVQFRERHQGGTNQWGVVATLPAPGPSDMSLSGDILAVGHTTWPSSASDSVTLFERSGGTWNLATVLYQPNGFGGQQFGDSVAVEGDTLLVGAGSAKVAGVEGAGTVFVFFRDQGGPNNWGLVTKIKQPDPTENAYFGSTVALSGDLALVGEPGQSHLMQRDRGGIDNWGLVASFPNFGEGTIDGSTAVIGSSEWGYEHVAYVYDGLLANCPMSYCTAGTSASGCQALLSASGTPSATRRAASRSRPRPSRARRTASSSSAPTASRPTPGATARATSASCRPSCARRP